MKYAPSLCVVALAALLFNCKSDLEDKTATPTTTTPTTPTTPANLFATTTHVTAAANISGNTSRIDDSGLNGKAEAFAFLTPNWQLGSVYNTSATGIYYTSGAWRVFNQDLKAFPSGMGYNVLIVQPHDNVFKHVASTGNTSAHVTRLDHPKLNGNPNAKLLVQQRWNGTYNDSPVGVWYDGSRWTIFNQKTAVPIRAGSEFNVLVNDNITATQAVSGKITGNNFLIDPAITGNTKRVFVTQYWTAVYNTQEVGVWYPSSSWSIYNQNSSVTMPTNARFFVFVP